MVCWPVVNGLWSIYIKAWSARCFATQTVLPAAGNVSSKGEGRALNPTLTAQVVRSLTNSKCRWEGILDLNLGTLDVLDLPHDHVIVVDELFSEPISLGQGHLPLQQRCDLQSHQIAYANKYRFVLYDLMVLGKRMAQWKLRHWNFDWYQILKLLP